MLESDEVLEALEADEVPDALEAEEALLLVFDDVEPVEVLLAETEVEESDPSLSPPPPQAARTMLSASANPTPPGTNHVPFRDADIIF